MHNNYIGSTLCIHKSQYWTAYRKTAINNVFMQYNKKGYNTATKLFVAKLCIIYIAYITTY